MSTIFTSLETRARDQLERRVARDQAHRLAAAKTADPDNSGS
jgi:hypothetical protein